VVLGRKLMVYEEIVVDLSLCLYVPSPNESCLYGPGYRIPDDRYRDISDRNISSESITNPSLLLADIPASNTTAIG